MRLVTLHSIAENNASVYRRAHTGLESIVEIICAPKQMSVFPVL
jgi:hypothetical protein